MRQLSMAGYDATYGYDAKDERVAWADSAEQGIRHTLRGLGSKVLREVTYAYNASSNTWQVFWEKDSIWAGSRLLAAVSRTGGLQHYHVDHLGSPRMVTNRCGQRLKLFDHNPWGLDRFASTQDPERHRFTAHQRDVGLLDRSWDDLDYMHARYYTGYLGRFLSVDPGRDVDAHKPQAWNLYAYVRGNPVNAVDPAGRFALAPIVFGAAVGGVGHLYVEMAINGKSLSEALRGAPRAVIVGGLGGVAKVGAFLAAAGQFYFSFRDEGRKGAEMADAAKVAGTQASMVLLGSGAGGVIGQWVGKTELGSALGAAATGEFATRTIQGVDALKNELEPLMKESSPQLKDKLDQIKELARDTEEQTKRLVKVNEDIDPSKGQ